MKLRLCLSLGMLSFLLFHMPCNVIADSVCCKSPTLPMLASDTDTSFYQVRSGIVHGTLMDVGYTNYLGASKKMRIYLPPNYDSSTLYYPVLYLNHGSGGDETTWTLVANANSILDNLIADYKAVPMIIVMPRYPGSQGGTYIQVEPAPLGNDDVITQELTKDIIPYVESHYRAKPDRLYRAIAGLSSGGLISVNTGLRRLDIFSEMFLYSPYYSDQIRANTEQNLQSILTDPHTNNERLTVPLYMAMGDADTSLGSFTILDTLLTQYDINHYYVLSTGGHDYMNWRRYLHQTAQIMFPTCTLNRAFTLGSDEALKANTDGKDNPNLQAGYAKLVMDSGSTPYGTAVFMYKQSGITISEAGVPASPPTTHARVFIDYRSGAPGVPSRTDSGIVDINTGIAIVNTGYNTANITYALLGVDGTTLTTGHGTLAVGKHFAKFINQLNEVAPDFALPAELQFASLDILGNQPFSVTALRMTQNQREEPLFTTTPVADLTKPLTDTPLYFPQLADGGGWITSLILLNTSGSVETGSLNIFDKNGTPLVISHAGGASASSFPYSIPSNGTFRFQTNGSLEHQNVGWVQLVPDAMNSTPIGSGMFSFNPVDVMTSESGIPSVPLSTTHARVFIDRSGNHNTGLAIVNLDHAVADVTIKAFDIDGVTPVGQGQKLLQLAGFGHDSQFADQLISNLVADFNGVLDISAPTPFAAITVRSLYNEREDFLITTFPVADATRPAPSPIVFPQIADGGGYVSQFIALSPEGASDTSLILYDENGILFSDVHNIE
jgi:enterochelin esterase-like enzyme